MVTEDGIERNARLKELIYKHKLKHKQVAEIIGKSSALVASCCCNARGILANDLYKLESVLGEIKESRGNKAVSLLNDLDAAAEKAKTSGMSSAELIGAVEFFKASIEARNSDGEELYPEGH